MGMYIYESPEGEVKEVFQKMDELHVYAENGVEWKRVFVNPTASVDTKIDPFSSKDFTEKTGKKKGTMGNLFDASKEASMKREEVMGKDPVKEKFLKDYSDKRGGKAHPSTWKKDITIEI